MQLMNLDEGCRIWLDARMALAAVAHKCCTWVTPTPLDCHTSP